MMEIFIGKASEPTIGKWVALPVEKEELEKIINEITCDGAQDYIIADWEDLPLDGDDLTHENPFTLNKLAEIAEESEENRLKILLLSKNGYTPYEILGWYESNSWEDIEIIYFPEDTEHLSFEERLVYYLIDEGILPEPPKAYEFYIDYRKMGADLMLEGWFEVETGVAGRLP